MLLARTRFYDRAVFGSASPFGWKDFKTSEFSPTPASLRGASRELGGLYKRHLKLSRLLSLSLAAVGSSASVRVLQRRHEWEQLNNRVAICVDYDDAYSAAIRAAMSFDDLLHEASHHGATHVSLPELTLNRLRTLGRLTPQVPSSPIQSSPRVGHWNYLQGDPLLVKQLVPELLARVPYTQARLIDQHTLAFCW